MKSFVGLPTDKTEATCSYSPDLDRPECTETTTLHLAVRDPGWGVVGLNACPEHEAIARGVGELVGEHRFDDLCRFPTGECWS